MIEVMTQGRAAKRDKVHRVADDIVTANSLATHLGCTRQNIARLTAEAVIEQRSDGCYDQTASRLKLHQAPALAPVVALPRLTPRTSGTKAEMLQIRIMERQRKLVPREAVDELIDSICGVVLTAYERHGVRDARATLKIRRQY